MNDKSEAKTVGKFLEQKGADKADQRARAADHASVGAAALPKRRR